jgi:hypothetical protein
MRPAETDEAHIILRGKALRRYERVGQHFGVTHGVVHFALTLLDMAPPDLSWLVERALERRAIGQVKHDE